MAVLGFFALLLLIVLPLGEVSRMTLGLSVSFTGIDILVVGGSVAWIVSSVIKHTLRIGKLEKYFLLTVGVFAVSLVVNLPDLSLIQASTAGLYIVRWFCYGILFFMTVQSIPSNKKSIGILALLSSFLILLGGYLQYFLYPSLRNLIYFGWDEHFYRMFGTFFDPNFFGLFLTLSFLFTLWYADRYFHYKKVFIFLMLFLATLLIGIFLTYSRTALFALLPGLLIYFWNRKRAIKIITCCFLFVIVLLVGISFIPKATNTNVIFRSVSADARIGSARNAFSIFLDNPLIGVGFNAYRYSMYRHHFQPGSAIQEDHGASGADSSVLLVLATSGVVGVFVFLLYWTELAKTFFRKKSRIGISVLVSFFIGSFFVNGLFYPLLLAWVWTVLGIVTTSDGR